MSHRHRIRVRYGECDQQGVVFNAHYLAYIDDTLESWLDQAVSRDWETSWDFMLKTATIVWQGPVRARESVDIAATVERWGTTSFTLGYEGTVEGRPAFTASVVYVGVVPGTSTPQAPPANVVEHLGRP